MIKIKINYSLLMLLLLFLVMGCNLKSPEVTVYGKDDPFMRDLFKVSLEDDLLKLPIEGVISGREQSILKRSVEEGIIGEHMSIEFVDLLDAFNVSSEGKKVIEYFLGIVTNASIGAESDKTYQIEEFYGLLRDLGSTRVHGIIGSVQCVFEVQEAAKSAIRNINSERSKQRLNVLFMERVQRYKSDLKRAFSVFEADEVYERFINYHSNGNGINKFIEIKNDAFQIIEGEELLSVLTEKEREVLEYMLSVVTDPNVYESVYIKSISDAQFYHYLKTLGDDKVKEIIIYHLFFFERLKNVDKLINDIKGENLKQQLKYEVDECKNRYSLSIKRPFCHLPFVPTVVYETLTNFGIHEYVDCLGEILDQGEGILESEKLYVWLSDDERKVIEYIQNIVTDPYIGLEEDLGVCFEYKFFSLLNSEGIDDVRRMINNVQMVLVLLQETDRLIDDVSKKLLRRRLEVRLNSCKNDYSLHLKRVFDGSVFIPLADAVLDDDAIGYISYINDIKDEAMASIEFDRLCSELSEDEKEAIFYIRNTVTNSDLPNDFGVNFNEPQFYILLKDLGIPRVREIVQSTLLT
ncbi:BTA121 domain-containing protein surface lipoprotein, partial [Borrelia anserina]